MSLSPWQLYYANESAQPAGACSLEAPVRIYVSEDNPGAGAVADELCNAVLNLQVIRGGRQRRGGTGAFGSVFCGCAADASSTPRFDRSDAGLAQAFARVDTDASGSISNDEMLAHIASVYGGYCAALPTRPPDRTPPPPVPPTDPPLSTPTPTAAHHRVVPPPLLSPDGRDRNALPRPQPHYSLPHAG